MKGAPQNEYDLRLAGFIQGLDGQWRKATKSGADPSRLHTGEPKPVEGGALERGVSRKEESASRFEIRFTVHSVRPLDFDGHHIKPCIDMLAIAGLIPGDAWHQLEGHICSRKVLTKEEEKTIVEITPL